MTEDAPPDIESSLHSNGAAGVVRMGACYRASVDDLWSAITDPRRLAEWHGHFDVPRARLVSASLATAWSHPDGAVPPTRP